MFKKFNFKNEYIHCIPSDESLIGKRVLCGDTWTDIKGQVENNNWTSRRRTLKSIDYESCCPFVIDDNYKTGQYKFIYYDPEWEIEKVYYCYLHKDEPEFIFDKEKPSSHVYAELTDYFEANEWCKKHDRFALEAKAWEEGKTIQYLNESAKWIDCAYNEPCWDLDTKYRVKPDEEIYDVYITTCFQHTPEFMIFKHSMAVHRGGIRYYKGTKSECENWIESHKKFKDLMYAWEYEDKTIQYYSESWEDWEDCADNNPFWDLNIDYRIKPNEPIEVETSKGKMYLANGAEIQKKRLMTNRELAKWLAQGKGQYKHRKGTALYVTYIYSNDDAQIDESIVIRGWDETEWHEPIVQEAE